jgi:DNA-binding MltR family transcriptional regulator
LKSIPNRSNNESPMAKKKSRKKLENLDDWDGFFTECLDESDRGTVIVGASFLDEHLRELIENFLIDKPKQTELLLGNDRPLGSFGARIRTAYCLGLLTEDEFHDLKIVRSVRNAFAHRIHGLSFLDHEIQGFCSSFKMFSSNKSCSPRDAYIHTLANLAARIDAYKKNLKKRCVVKKSNRTKSPE